MYMTTVFKKYMVTFSPSDADCFKWSDGRSTERGGAEMFWAALRQHSCTLRAAPAGNCSSLGCVWLFPSVSRCCCSVAVLPWHVRVEQSAADRPWGLGAAVCVLFQGCQLPQDCLQDKNSLAQLWVSQPMVVAATSCLLLWQCRIWIEDAGGKSDWNLGGAALQKWGLDY